MTKKKLFDWQYTIGEILIVSVGIMIAFSINTCASEIQEKNVHKEYTTSLVADLDQNLDHLNSIISAQETKVQVLNHIINSIGTEDLDLDEMGQILSEQRKSPTFYPINGTFKSLVSHGEVELFDTKTKRELFNLYDTWYSKIVYNGNLFDKTYLEIYDREVRNLLDLRSKKIFNLDRFYSEEFSRNLAFVIDEAESYISLAKKSKLESEKMREVLVGEE